MKMKTNMKNAAIFMVFLMIMSFIAIQTASAAEILLDTSIKSAVTKIDKNGNEYVRFIIEEKKSLNGFEYTAETVVMAFGASVTTAKTLSAGSNLKAIVAANEYQGRTNYNIVAFVTGTGKKS